MCFNEDLSFLRGTVYRAVRAASYQAVELDQEMRIERRARIFLFFSLIYETGLQLRERNAADSFLSPSLE